MNRINRSLLICFISGVSFVSCQRSLLQTVETGDLQIEEQDPKYKFTRNLESSVDTQEPDLLTATIQDLHERFFDQAYIRDQEQMNTVRTIFEQGLYGYAPKDYLAKSDLHSGNTRQVKSDIDNLIASIAYISGLGSENPAIHRRREAKPSQTGYIDGSQSGRLTFVDESGLVVSQALKGFILGAMNIDQIINIHLDDRIILDKSIEADHENQVLIKGANYTALEHHWDLAYGYYIRGIRALALSEGIIELRGSARKLDLAFTLGRIDINYHLYDMLPKHVQTIRNEIAHVLVVRLQHLLLGGNTMANLYEHPPFAFPMLSDAYGLIYALQFLKDKNGKPYISYNEVINLQKKLLGEGGLWNHRRLIDREANQGELNKIMNEIKEHIKMN